MTDTLHIIALGIIEGITEFLPVSSTGHLLVAEQWLGARSDLFNIGIQAGAILAIVLVYWRRLLDLLAHRRNPATRDYFNKLCTAFLITAVGGFIATRLGFKLDDAAWPIAAALFLGGIGILLVERHVAGRPQSQAVTWSVAIWVGLAQIAAGLLPGVSRSAATIFAAMLAGLTARPDATEFAFLVGIPTMFAATGYELLKAEGSSGSGGSEDWTGLAIGFITAAIVAFIAVKWLLRYIKSHRFTLFAWYRILAGLTLMALLLTGRMH